MPEQAHSAPWPIGPITVKEQSAKFYRKEGDEPWYSHLPKAAYALRVSLWPLPSGAIGE
jgi:hypothetical protein